MIYKTLGIVIKKKDLKDADRLLTIYTQNFGKIIVKAKSVKKSQSKLKGHLELFVYNHLMIAHGKSLDVIINAETIKNYFFMRSNLFHISAAYYFAELIDKLIAEPQKDKNIWNLLISSLNCLNKQKTDINSLVSSFELKLLKYLGYDLNSKEQKPLTFIQHTLGEKINSKKYLNMLKY